MDSKYISLITFEGNSITDSQAVDEFGGAIYLSNKYAGDFTLQATTAQNVYAN